MRRPFATLFCTFSFVACAKGATPAPAGSSPSSSAILEASAPARPAPTVRATPGSSARTAASASASVVPSASAPPRGSGREAGADAAPAVEFDPSLPIGSAVHLACHGRTPCHLMARGSAGRDDAGRDLEVIALDLMPLDEAGTPKYIADGGALAEQWSVVYARAASGAPEVHLLSTSGWGPFGPMGPATPILAPNRATLETIIVGAVSGGLTSRRVLQLSPLSVRKEEDGVFGRTQAYASESRWSWDSFGGDYSWFNDGCVPDGGADPGDWSSDGPDGGPPLGGEAYLYVPRVTIDDPAFATDGWKTTNLATCAALVDASGFHGFSLHGKAGGAGASMRVLAIGADDFLVELRDDASVGRRDAAASGEGLEVWAAGEEPDRCPHESLSVEWLVRADDGRVTAGFGTPGVAALSVTRATDGAVVRLKLHLTAPHTALAFAYRDSKQRVFATSRERPGDAASLGVLRVLDPKDASCRVVAGGDAAAGRRLEPVDRRGEPPPLAN